MNYLKGCPPEHISSEWNSIRVAVDLPHYILDNQARKGATKYRAVIFVFIEGRQINESIAEIILMNEIQSYGNGKILAFKYS